MANLFVCCFCFCPGIRTGGGENGMAQKMHLDILECFMKEVIPAGRVQTEALLWRCDAEISLDLSI